MLATDNAIFYGEKLVPMVTICLSNFFTQQSGRNLDDTAARMRIAFSGPAGVDVDGL